MEIFKQIAPLKAFLKARKRDGKSIGLVPTMGALHAGHEALIKASQSQNQVTVGTIFVNPTQFNNPNDLLQYPRRFDSDSALLETLGCDALFCPEVSEIYPQQSSLKFDFGLLDKVMEGQFRPGHFSGVGLVVSKFFNIVAPDHAYFGQKDWQQFAVIRKMAEELNFDIQLHSVPTIRESDGLAMSSRNLRLDDDARKKAPVFFRGLQYGKSALLAGEKLKAVKAEVAALVRQYPDVTLEYFELADSKNLNLLNNVEESVQPILCIAGYVGGIRLIDNLFLNGQ